MMTLKDAWELFTLFLSVSWLGLEGMLYSVMLVVTTAVKYCTSSWKGENEQTKKIIGHISILEKLPTEVIHLMTEYLSIEEIGNLRLVSRNVNFLAQSPTYFSRMRTLVLDMTPSRLQRLENISESEKFRERLHELTIRIVYYGDNDRERYTLIGSERCASNGLDEMPPHPIPSYSRRRLRALASEAPEKSQARYRWLEDMTAEQAGLLATKRASLMLHRTFLNLKRLGRMELATVVCFDKDLFVPVETLCEEHADVTRRTCRIIAGAMSSWDRLELDTLALSGITKSSFVPSPLVTLLVGSYSSVYSSLDPFISTTTLQLRVDAYGDDQDGSTDDDDIRAFEHLVHGMPRIAFIELDVRFRSYGYELKKLRLKHAQRLLQFVQFSTPLKLVLSNIEIDYSILSVFLRRIPQLRHIGFHDVWIKDGTWFELLEAMCEMENLQFFDLNELHEEPPAPVVEEDSDDAQNPEEDEEPPERWVPFQKIQGAHLTKDLVKEQLSTSGDA